MSDPAADLISVLTCPRRPWHLEDTLAQVDRQGGSQTRRFVLSDGEPSCHFRTLPAAWQYFHVPGPSGQQRAMWSVFRQAMQLGFERLLYCEDDIVVARNGISRALAVEIPDDVSHVHFYDAKEFEAAGRALSGLQKIPALGKNGRGIWGSMCLLIPRRTVERCLSREPAAWEMPFKPQEPGSGGDCLLSWVAHTGPTPVVAMHMPSLVDHCGDTTASVNARRRRRTMNFAGHG